MRRYLGLVLVIAVSLTALLLAGRGEAPACRSACLGAPATATHPDSPDACALSASCGGGAALALADLAALATTVPFRLLPPHSVARVRRERRGRVPHRLLVTGLDRPPQT